MARHKLFTRRISTSYDPPPLVHSRRVVITGLGLVTPLGCGVETTWNRLIGGECGVRKLTLEDLKINGFDSDTQSHTFDQLTSKSPQLFPVEPAQEHRSIARFIGYALCAADEALRDANWMPTVPEDKKRTGVSVGGGTGSISDILDAAQLICKKRLRWLSPFFIPRILINMAAGHVSMKYGFQLSYESRIGEGSGILVLEELEHAKNRGGAKIYGEVRGYGMTGDAYHITQPHTDGRARPLISNVGVFLHSHSLTRGAILAMTSALRQSGLHPHQVDYVNAHATSTSLGDSIEANAIRKVFSDHATSGSLALFSTKFQGAVGHLLGAAGAVEAIFSILAMHNGVALLMLNLSKPDPLFEDVFMPLTATKEMNIRAALSNLFGFGGTNASLLCTSPPTQEPFCFNNEAHGCLPS